jgi:hypothetical protein
MKRESAFNDNGTNLVSPNTEMRLQFEPTEILRILTRISLNPDKYIQGVDGKTDPRRLDVRSCNMGL